MPPPALFAHLKSLLSRRDAQSPHVVPREKRRDDWLNDLGKNNDGNRLADGCALDGHQQTLERQTAVLTKLAAAAAS